MLRLVYLVHNWQSYSLEEHLIAKTLLPRCFNLFKLADFILSLYGNNLRLYFQARLIFTPKHHEILNKSLACTKLEAISVIRTALLKLCQYN